MNSSRQDNSKFTAQKCKIAPTLLNKYNLNTVKLLEIFELLKNHDSNEDERCLIELKKVSKKYITQESPIQETNKREIEEYTFLGMLCLFEDLARLYNRILKDSWASDLVKNFGIKELPSAVNQFSQLLFRWLKKPNTHPYSQYRLARKESESHCWMQLLNVALLQKLTCFDDFIKYLKEKQQIQKIKIKDLQHLLSVCDKPREFKKENVCYDEEKLKKRCEQIKEIIACSPQGQCSGSAPSSTPIAESPQFEQKFSTPTARDCAEEINTPSFDISNLESSLKEFKETGGSLPQLISLLKNAQPVLEIFANDQGRLPDIIPYIEKEEDLISMMKTWLSLKKMESFSIYEQYEIMNAKKKSRYLKSSQVLNNLESDFKKILLNYRLNDPILTSFLNKWISENIPKDEFPKGVECALESTANTLCQRLQADFFKKFQLHLPLIIQETSDPKTTFYIRIDPIFGSKTLSEITEEKEDKQKQKQSEAAAKQMNQQKAAEERAAALKKANEEYQRKQEEEKKIREKEIRQEINGQQGPSQKDLFKLKMAQNKEKQREAEQKTQQENEQKKAAQEAHKEKWRQTQAIAKVTQLLSAHSLLSPVSNITAVKNLAETHIEQIQALKQVEYRASANKQLTSANPNCLYIHRIDDKEICLIWRVKEKVFQATISHEAGEFPAIFSTRGDVFTQITSSQNEWRILMTTLENILQNKKPANVSSVPNSRAS